MAATFMALEMMRQAGEAWAHHSARADRDNSVVSPIPLQPDEPMVLHFSSKMHLFALWLINTLDKFKRELKCPFLRTFIVERRISHALFLCFSFQFYGVEEVRLLIVHPVNRGSSADGGRWQGAAHTFPHIRVWKIQLELGVTLPWVGKKFAGKK